MRKQKYFHRILSLLVLTWFGTSCNILHLASSKSDFTGKYQITISVLEGTIIGKGELNQTDSKVNGWVGQSEKDPIPVTGTLEKGKLILITKPQPGRTVAFNKVVLSIKGDTLTGAIEQGSHGKGTIKFLRLR